MTTQPQRPSPCPSNPSILEALIACHGAELRAQAARHAPDPDSAEDAMQDAAVEFLRYYKGPPGRDALRYLMVCVKRRAWAIAAAGEIENPPARLNVSDAERRVGGQPKRRPTAPAIRSSPP